MNGKAAMVMTTFPNEETAKRILNGLLERRLAACVQTLPVRSAYHWKGALQHETEVLALIKTKRALYPEVEVFLKAAHPYETPEIVLLAIEAGSKAYMAYLTAETK